MRVHLVAEAAGAAVEWHQRASAAPRLWWDGSMGQLTLQLGYPAESCTLEVVLGPTEAAELYRRLRESYPPAQPRRRRR